MLQQGRESEPELQNILICCVAEDSRWNVDFGIGVAGNYTVERFINDIQSQLDIRNEEFYSHYLIEAHGSRYADGPLDQKEADWQLAETCDRWRLVRHETYPGSQQTYAAIVVLYYEPAKIEPVANQSQGQ